MVNNISCHSAGCTQPVIGQCSGYKGRCGRFACSEHYDSKQALCSVCYVRLSDDVEKALREIALEAIKNDYEQTALAFYKQHRSGLINFIAGYLIWCGLVGLFILAGILIGIALNLQGNGLAFLVAGTSTIPPTVILIFLVRKSSTKKNTQLRSIETTHPNFKQFYYKWVAEYEKQKNAKMRSAVIDGLIVATAVGIGVSETIRQQREDEIVRKLRNSL